MCAQEMHPSLLQLVVLLHAKLAPVAVNKKPLPEKQTGLPTRSKHFTFKVATLPDHALQAGRAVQQIGASLTSHPENRPNDGPQLSKFFPRRGMRLPSLFFKVLSSMSVLTPISPSPIAVSPVGKLA